MDNISKATVEDSASEKLVGDTRSDFPSKDQKVEIKYMTDSQNGDTKIDIENLKSVFVGMGKEELMKYANDPFWVKMRWFLFVMFWVLWFAMLSGAIAIIVLAPKCAAPTPREWYEQSPIYKINLKKSVDFTKNPPEPMRNIEALKKQIDYFKELGTETILVDSLMTSTNGNESLIEDFMSVDPSYGSVADFKNLMKAMKEKGLHLLMNFVPNYSSDRHSWFNKSVAKEEPFKDYYVWAPSKGLNGEGQLIPPNNWLSVTGGSAWEWNEVRGEFYLHQFDKNQPDLNFHNRGLVDYFKGVFKFWLELGISGFHLNHVEYLLEDESLKNEGTGVDAVAIGATHDQYVFYNHRHTKHLPDTLRLIEEWTASIQNYSGILAVTGLSQEEGEKVGQLFWQPLEVSPVLDAEALSEMVQKRLNRSSPVWEWTCKETSFCLDSRFERALQMSLLLLPGTTVINSGEEFSFSKQGDLRNSSFEELKNDLESGFNMYRNLMEARLSPSVMYGTTQTAILNSTVFSYSRIKSGNPGYLVVFNLADEDTTVNIQDLKFVPPEVTVVARTPEFSKSLSPKNKISSSVISIPGKSTLVVTFVPEADSK